MTKLQCKYEDRPFSPPGHGTQYHSGTLGLEVWRASLAPALPCLVAQVVTRTWEPGQRAGSGAQVHPEQGTAFSALRRRLMVLEQLCLNSHGFFRKDTVISGCVEAPSFGYEDRGHDKGQLEQAIG